MDYPTINSNQGGRPHFKGPTNFVIAFIRPHAKTIMILFALWILSVGLAAAQPLAMAPMVELALEQTNIFSGEATGEVSALSDVTLNNVDQYVSQTLDLGAFELWDVVLILSAIFLGLVILKALADTLSFYLLTRIRVDSLRHLQSYIFSHMVSLSFDYFNQERSGSLVSRLQQDAASSINSFTSMLNSLLTAPIMVIFYGILLVRTNFRLMVLITVIAAIQWGLAHLLRTRVRALMLDEFDLLAENNAFLHEVFQNIRVVKSFVAEKYEQANLRERFERIIPVHINRALYRYWQEPMVTIVSGAANVGILLLSARELFAGQLTVTGFFLFLYIGRSIIPPISRLGQAYLSTQEMSAAAERIYEIVNIEPSIMDGAKQVTELRENIRFQNVSFSYGDEPVLRDINVELKHGQMLALVGPSGAGKSTLVDLLLRFYDPSEGSVTIDGQDLRELEIKTYRRMFGVVAQENLLFNDTIARNIGYGQDNPASEKLRSAAEIANALEFIEQMPKGFETEVGDRGVRLSGGQRQRIAIARAIAHEPEILILDEATSSLDTESERLVQAAIDRAIQNTTAVVIAHRLSTVLHADKIVVLQEGRILDQGKHDELIERCTLYRHLCELQFRLNDAGAAAAL